MCPGLVSLNSIVLGQRHALVHVKQVELSHFKSFGGTASLALEQGFTVVTGPNGSGKSNIIDGLLFCLGLA
ncbi:MAG: hypothetical protein ERJ69_01455, partial [Aphanocapsa feldmannii 288cV]